jgi:hypothetical protein
MHAAVIYATPMVRPATSTDRGMKLMAEINVAAMMGTQII